MTTWLTGPKLGEARGYTRGQIKARRERHWTRGVEYAEVDGTTLYNLEAIDARADRIAEEVVAASLTPIRRFRAKRLAVVRLK